MIIWHGNKQWSGNKEVRHFLNNFPFGIQLIIITLNSLAAIRFHFLAVGLLTHETILLASLKSGLRSPLLSRTWRYTVPVFSSLGIVGTGGLSFIGTGDRERLPWDWGQWWELWNDPVGNQWCNLWLGSWRPGRWDIGWLGICCVILRVLTVQHEGNVRWGLIVTLGSVCQESSESWVASFSDIEEYKCDGNDAGNYLVVDLL